jgi:exopolyphosphatase/guanosine-5'-triphosphate,3'-diphosphate pyrophosphatase
MFGFSRVFTQPPEVVAAIDLGSNSFHMIVARVSNGDLQVIDRIKEMVRLGAGLQEDKTLDAETQARALDCLQRFGQRLRSMSHDSVRAVGTNTLRQARNADAFLIAAEQALGHPIEVVAGREEARLVYLGVSHGLTASEERRLVVDIGGGSTELIIGEGFTPIVRESLHMGCVSMSRSWFADGTIRRKTMEKAVIAARLEVSPVETRYKILGWQAAVGSSGTIRSIRDVVHAAGWSERGITLQALRELQAALVAAGHLDKLQLEGLTEERKPVFPGGVAVLLGVFEELGIEQMGVSDEALREGLLYDLMGRIQHEDARERTVNALSNRWSADTEHAARVRATAIILLDKLTGVWNLPHDEYVDMLSWAASLHEVGLTVAHSQYQKHGAYLLENSDLSGFSRQEQRILAALVRGHRRKFPLAYFTVLPDAVTDPAIRLCIILRMAALLHRSRDDTTLPDIEVSGDPGCLVLMFPDGWLKEHPLTRAELKREKHYLKPVGIKLKAK